MDMHQSFKAHAEARSLHETLMLQGFGVDPIEAPEAGFRRLAQIMDFQVLPNGTTTQAAMITAMIELDRAWSACVLTRTESAQDDLEDAMTQVQDACQAMLDAAKVDLANADKPMIEVA
jgi:hypothetical protein